MVSLLKLLDLVLEIDHFLLLHLDFQAQGHQLFGEVGLGCFEVIVGCGGGPAEVLGLDYSTEVDRALFDI